MNEQGIDTRRLFNQSLLLERITRLLAIHLREIANNESYQHHKGIRNARLREVDRLAQLLQEIKDVLQEESEAQA